MDKSIREVVYETAKDLHSAGVMSDARLREFEALCSPCPKAYSPAQIRRIRKRAKASVLMFAAYLNISQATVRRWERGQARPCGPSLQLLSIVDRKGLEALA